VSANYQTIPGAPIYATYTATTAEVQRSLGRPLAGGARTVTLHLISPGTQYDRRQHQMDLRFTRSFRLGGMSFEGMLDIYNVLNGNYSTTIRTVYGPQYLYPTRIMTARMFKVGGQVSF
jgi:hypothetical protein